jgi:hypothetical protein
MTVKEAPARRGLRSVFAGLFGRGKSAPAPAAPKAADDQAGHVKVIAPETATPETTPEAVVAETTTGTVEPETVVAETATPEPVAAQTETAEPETVVAETDSAEAALPLANYDTLTVASLRARLRNLTTEDLAVLIDYEKAHQGREEVITMFERRVAKIAAGLTTGFPAIS